MSIQTIAFCEHNLHCATDSEEVLQRFIPYQREILGANACFDSTMETPRTEIDQQVAGSWTAFPIPTRLPDCRWYELGDVLLSVGPKLARMCFSGRYAGFLEIAPLREAHFQAMNAMAAALGARRLLIGDEQHTEVITHSMTIDEAANHMRQRYGQAETSLDPIPQEITSGTRWPVWFLIELPANAQPKR